MGGGSLWQFFGGWKIRLGREEFRRRERMGECDRKEARLVDGKEKSRFDQNTRASSLMVTKEPNKYRGNPPQYSYIASHCVAYT